MINDKLAMPHMSCRPIVTAIDSAPACMVPGTSGLGGGGATVACGKSIADALRAASSATSFSQGTS